MAQTMHARNAVSAKMAECYIYIPNESGVKERYNFMSAINVEVNFQSLPASFCLISKRNI